MTQPLDFQISVDSKDLAAVKRMLKGLSLKQRDSILLRSFRQAAVLVERKLKSNVTGRILNRVSGHLAQSIQTKVEQNINSGEIKATIGSGVRDGFRMPYANIHETGGVIRPKRGKYLTIPFPYAQTAAGVTKYTARELFNQFRGRVFIAHGIIFLQRSKTNFQPMFKLVRSVKIPARRYLSVTLTQMKDRFVMAMRGAVERSIKNEQN